MRQDHSDKKGDGSLRMQRKNLYSAIFLVLFSVVTIHLALRLPLGHAAKPGPGLFPLLMSGFIALLAFLLFFTTVLSVTQSGSFDSNQNYLTAVGSYPGSASFYGTFDQGGNVFEWNDAVISGSFRGLRGGTWLFIESSLRSSNRNSDNPDIEFRTIGFRVASP